MPNLAHAFLLYSTTWIEKVQNKLKSRKGKCLQDAEEIGLPKFFLFKSRFDSYLGEWGRVDTKFPVFH